MKRTDKITLAVAGGVLVVAGIIAAFVVPPLVAGQQSGYRDGLCSVVQCDD